MKPSKQQKYKLKVCGMRENLNILEVANLRPDYMGFIFHESSPRDVTHIADALPLGKISKKIKKVAVVVDKPIEYVLEIVERYKFDLIQLHGSESPEYCKLVQRKIPVIKVFSVWDALPENLNSYQGVCDFFLFDTKGDKAGGNGIVFSHEILKSYPLDKPFFLSGGLAPEHTQLVARIRMPYLYGVDINSRFETKPGLKDAKLVKYFKDKLNNSYA